MINPGDVWSCLDAYNTRQQRSQRLRAKPRILLLCGKDTSMATTRVTPTISSADTIRTDWVAVARQLGPTFAARAAAHDANDTFVADNYAELKQHKVFSAGVPTELGGGGASHAELCAMLRELAHACGSTALALSMHTHLLAATVWRWRQGQPVEPLLKRIAAEETVLISSGGSDWLDSSGKAEKVDGGFRVTARKIFSSGCPMGDLLVTSAVYDDPQDGPTALHFPVAFMAEGVTIMDNWRTLGMRGTGSHDTVLDGVFVPESAVSLRRPKGKWHPFFGLDHGTGHSAPSILPCGSVARRGGLNGAGGRSTDCKIAANIERGF